MQTILLISLGAVAGANLRYFVAQYVARIIPSSFPFGTLIINITASFVLGFFLIWTTERVLADPRWRLLIAVGFCGSYSTYSSYAFETFALFEQRSVVDRSAECFCYECGLFRCSCAWRCACAEHLGERLADDCRAGDDVPERIR